MSQLMIRMEKDLLLKPIKRSVGVESRAAEEELGIQQTFVDDFQRRRQQVSGVSLDEEISLLIQYQRAFEGSARVITVTDRMLGMFKGKKEAAK